MNVVEFSNVSKKRDEFHLKELNFSIPQGFITGFIGPNGSGKTSTIQMMMDILQVDNGDIFIYGDSHKNHHTKQKIGFVYDELFMYGDFTIKKMKSIIAPLYENWNEEVFHEHLQEFNLPLNKKIKKFSKGMKMKCSLLFALAHEPEFIVMDEPTAGLDPIFRRELLDLLQNLMIREEQTIFFSTHNTTDLDRIADYIVFIHEGRIIFQQSMEQIREQFHVVKGKLEFLDEDIRNLFKGIQETSIGFTALFEGDPILFADFSDELVIEKATLEDIMYFIVKGGQ
ncbi:ABC transporter ATP-binding protein [Pseudogracilibacillus sp. SE30717A]|uniref:ABC transporter ATP-binding protein n=1 Tax=Pseudogracilibacillus sp. SE30717A TaxID=3098293 RepID=UPI00300E5B6A